MEGDTFEKRMALGLQGVIKNRVAGQTQEQALAQVDEIIESAQIQGASEADLRFIRAVHPLAVKMVHRFFNRALKEAHHASHARKY